MSPAGLGPIWHHIAVCANLFINNVYKYLYIASFVVVICVPVSGAMENNTCYHRNSYTPTHNTIWFTIGSVRFLFTQINKKKRKKLEFRWKNRNCKGEKITCVTLGYTYCAHVRLSATGSRREFGNDWEPVCSILHPYSIPSSKIGNEKTEKMR